MPMSAAQKTYTVAVAGLGKRGMHHAEAVAKNPRFKLVGLCDIDQARLDAAKQKFGVDYASTDAAQMLQDTKPDVFIFCTLPQIRLPLIQAGVEAGVKLIAYEKPIAMSMNEALEMYKLLRAGGRQDRGQPPAPLRRALPEGQGDHRQRRDRPRAHRLRARHRLDDAHDDPPDRVRQLVQRRRRGRVGGGPGGRQREVRRRPRLARLHRRAGPVSPTACAASSNAAPARPTCPKWTRGGASAASAPRAPRALPKC